LNITKGKKMNRKTELFLQAINTALYSWGGDTPADAIWAVNELLDFYEEASGNKLSGRIEEEPIMTDIDGDDFEGYAMTIPLKLDSNQVLLKEIENFPWN
jgi:hypothetical protein